MKNVFAREELCVNCHLCEVYCKTAHSASGDVLTANKYENPAPISRVKVYGDRVASVAVAYQPGKGVRRPCSLRGGELPSLR